MTRILWLPIKKVFFDMIVSGVKLEEYREIKPYWISRLISKEYIKTNGMPTYDDLVSTNGESSIVFEAIKLDFDAIGLNNGYGKGAAFVTLEPIGISIGCPKPEWSGGWDSTKPCFIIKLGKIYTISKKMWKKQPVDHEIHVPAMDIEKEVQARVEFKLKEFKTAVSNRLGFAYQRQWAEINQKTRYVYEAWDEISKMINKEIHVPTPYNEMHLRKKHEQKEKAVEEIMNYLNHHLMFKHHNYTIAKQIANVIENTAQNF